MRILLVEPNCAPRSVEITGSLESMQAIVGGLIQVIYPFEDEIALICNDEGKLLDLPFNRPLRNPETGEIYDIIAGNFFLCAAPSDSANFASLTDDQIEFYTMFYGGGLDG